MAGAHQLIHQSGSAEWYTPAWLIDRVRDFLGWIDLDPASCAQANRTVQASAFFTKEDNGLMADWVGRVFLNPPSVKSGPDRQRLADWVYKFRYEYRVGNMPQGILLIPATPDRQWFHPLWENPICFLWERIKFDAPEGVKSEQPTHPHALVYLGPSWLRYRFRETFADLGAVVLLDQHFRHHIPQHKGRDVVDTDLVT
jgi:ParB family chromosome partitioning protein